MKGYWRDVMRAVKRALFSTGKIRIYGQVFRVAYEARNLGDHRDYPVMMELARGKRCVFDVGANKGITAILMASVMHPNGQVWAFEASEEACRIIKENIELNGLQGKVHLVNAVVADVSGHVVDFFWSFSSGGASTIGGYLKHAQVIPKVTLAIDDFVSQMDLVPEFVKIDVEGSESKVLIGMKETLRRIRPKVLVELHSRGEMTVTKNAESILSVLDGVGYQMIYLRTKERVRDPNVLSGRGRTYVLLCPENEIIPDWLKNLDTSKL